MYAGVTLAGAGGHSKGMGAVVLMATPAKKNDTTHTSQHFSLALIRDDKYLDVSQQHSHPQHFDMTLIRDDKYLDVSRQQSHMATHGTHKRWQVPN